MKTSHITTLAGVAVAASVLVAGCATAPSPTSAELDALATQTIMSSFRDQGIAKVDRLKQDLGQSACSSDKPPSDAVAQRIMEEAKTSIKWPADGQYFGDFAAGERLAQNGRGATWTDAPGSANGGNCYNCHQISKAEVSYGNIGPSLYQYGKNRGISDVAAPTALPIIQYTWTKLYNSKAYAACSNMPRFGHVGLLDEKQMRDLMSLLLDPRSPVNQ